MSVKPLVAGNWKMNGLKASVAEFEAIAAGYDAALKAKAELAICPPFTLVATLAAKGLLPVGGQDCHAKVSGAHTGDTSAEMLKDAGATYVIVGHSERRTDHAETDAVVKAKTEAAWRAGLVAIVCVGETHAERTGAKTLEVVGTQVAGSLPDGTTAANTVIAYEPVWAIGTGLTATDEQANETIGVIRQAVRSVYGEAADKIRIQYGGSMNPKNAHGLMKQPEIDGGLIGGASLTAADFAKVVHFEKAPA